MKRKLDDFVSVKKALKEKVTEFLKRCVRD